MYLAVSMSSLDRHIIFFLQVKMAYINLVLMIDIAELAEVKGLLCGIVHE